MSDSYVRYSTARPPANVSAGGTSYVRFPAAASTGPFTPASKTGLLRWFRSSDGLVYDGANNITQWSDKSTNAANVTPPGTDPVRTAGGLNSLSVATFAPGTLLTGAAPTLSVVAPFTILLVAKNTGTNYPSAFGIPMESQSFAFQRSAGGTASYIGNGLFCYNAPLAATSTWAWYLMTYDGTGFTTLANHSFYTNGSLQTIVTIGQGSPGNTFAVGDFQSTPNSAWVGDIAEFAVYNTVLSADDLANFTAYMHSQWGF